MARKLKEPVWVERIVVDAVHLETLRTHGGLYGLRDENALESALARPRQRYAYGRKTDLVALAASYGYGLARNHPFRDGNKRIAFLVMVVFLELNGCVFEAPETEVVAVILQLSAGKLSEAKLATWLRTHTKKRTRRRSSGDR
jgi:death-on-curing protein